MRALRHAIASAANPRLGQCNDGIAQSGDNGLSAASLTPAMLPVMMERRELKPATPPEGALAGKGGGGGGKKGKKAGGKGAAVVEQPEALPEPPWRCRAVLNLRRLVEVVSVNKDSGDGGSDGKKKKSSSIPRGSIDTGHSPLWVELFAPLDLAAEEADHREAGAKSTAEGADEGERTGVVGAREGNETVSEIKVLGRMLSVASSQRDKIEGGRS